MKLCVCAQLLSRDRLSVTPQRPHKDPTGLQPAILLCPWDSPARIVEWVALSRGFPNAGIKPSSPPLAGKFITAPPGKSHMKL